jgi:uncharacterized protein involved in cysteine biosynthesis
MRKVWKRFRQLWKDERGLGTLEILLIIAVLVGIALLFREKIFEWVDMLLNRAGDRIQDFDPSSP